jgi:predicted nuclease of predicted toxin-antitoxin system
VIAFLADENLKSHIIRGLLRRNPSVDVMRARDAGLTGIEDRLLLEWAARHNRVLLTHDVQTLVGFAWESVKAGRPMAGVIVLGRKLRVSEAVEELLLIAECSEPEEWAGLPICRCEDQRFVVVPGQFIAAWNRSML